LLLKAPQKEKAIFATEEHGKTRTKPIRNALVGLLFFRVFPCSSVAKMFLKVFSFRVFRGFRG
jgi:hypothetical protein